MIYTYLSFAANFLLNPIILAVYLVIGFGESSYSRFLLRRADGNMVYMNPLIYLLVCLAVLALAFAFFQILQLNTSNKSSFLSMYSHSSFRMRDICYLVCLMVLLPGITNQGYEGNTLGLQILMLAVASAILVITGLMDYLQNPETNILTIQWNPWVLFALHSANPLISFFYFYSGMAQEQAAPLAHFRAALFTGLMFSCIVAGVTWVVFRFIDGNSFSFAAYFGSGQPIYYLFPQLLAVLFLWVNLFFPADKLGESSLPSIVPIAINILFALGVLAQGIFFVKQMKSFYNG